MSYGDIKRRTSEVQEMPAISHACPAYGCPNAAAVSLDAGGHWACYAHASVPFETWHEATTKIRSEWPASGNWGHPEKVLHEEQAAARRRAALKAT
jgi:hypothetical protein